MNKFWLLPLVVVSFGLASCASCACCQKKAEQTPQVTEVE